MDLATLETGNLVYQESGNGVLEWGLLLLVLIPIIYRVIKDSIEEKRFVFNSDYLGYLLFPLVIIGLNFLTQQTAPAFFEEGVVRYKQGQPFDFIPYEQFETIECYHRKTYGKTNRRYYGIIFHIQEQEVFLELTSKTKLDEIWDELSWNNPDLNNKLKTKDNSNATRSLYEYLISY